MLMQSNEPFSKVDQGMSPMTAGLLGGLAMGGLSAGYQGLGYLSYTGLDAKYEGGKEKANAKIAKLEAKAGSASSGTQGLNKFQRMHNSAVSGIGTAATAPTSMLVQGANTRVAKREGAMGKFDSKLTDREREQISRNYTQNKPVTSRHVNGQVKTFNSLLSSGEKAYNQQAKAESIHNSVVSSVNKVQNKLMFSENQTTSSGAPVESKKLTKQRNKLEGFSSANLAKEKEAHSWHGNNMKKASMKAGAFALGGFVVGGGVQMAVNSLNNA